MMKKWVTFVPTLLPSHTTSVGRHLSTILLNPNYPFLRQSSSRTLASVTATSIKCHVTNHTSQRSFSSKTPSKSNSLGIQADSDRSIALNSSNEGEITQTPPPIPSQPAIPVFSNLDIREMDEDTRTKIHGVSAQVAQAQSYSVMNPKHPRRRKEILVMDKSEYAGAAILRKKPPLLDRRSETESFWLRQMAPDKRNNADVLCFIQADIDIRPKSVRRIIKKHQVEAEALEQKYNSERNRVLGNELAAAHFIVARGGKVRFLGQKDWVTQYRKDAKPGVPEEDLPVMKFELCTLPVKFDPTYKIEAVDAQGVKLYYEGLDNFEKLRYVKWISFRDSPLLDDWCLDKVARIFSETLEYIDLSGCKQISDRGIGAFHRCSKLKAIRVENLPHLNDTLEIVSAMLEDHRPELYVIGVDYERKSEALRLEGEDLERKVLLERENETAELMIGSGNVMQSASHKENRSTNATTA